jgi:hypothetical protein
MAAEKAGSTPDCPAWLNYMWMGRLAIQAGDHCFVGPDV